MIYSSYQSYFNSITGHESLTPNLLYIFSLAHWGDSVHYLRTKNKWQTVEGKS